MRKDLAVLVAVPSSSSFAYSTRFSEAAAWPALELFVRRRLHQYSRSALSCSLAVAVFRDEEILFLASKGVSGVYASQFPGNRVSQQVYLHKLVSIGQ